MTPDINDSLNINITVRLSVGLKNKLVAISDKLTGERKNGVISISDIARTLMLAGMAVTKHLSDDELRDLVNRVQAVENVEKMRATKRKYSPELNIPDEYDNTIIETYMRQHGFTAGN